MTASSVMRRHVAPRLAAVETWPIGAAVGAVAVLGIFGVSLLAGRDDAPLLLAALVAAGGVALMFARPSAATATVLFLVYTNVPVVLAQRGFIPHAAAGAVALLFGIPLLHRLLRREGLRLDAPLILMIAWLGWMGITAFVAKDMMTAWKRISVFAMEGIVLYFLVLNVIHGPRQLRIALRTLFAGGALLGGLTLFQAVSGTYGRDFGGLAQRNLEYEEAANPGKNPEMTLADRARGPVDEPNRFAQMLVVLLPLAFFELRAGRARGTRVFAFVAGALMLAGVLLTYSRGAFVTLVALGFLLVLLGHLHAGKVLLVTVAAAMTIPLVAPGFYERIGSLEQLKALVSNDTRQRPEAVIRGRATEMLAAYWVFREHPIVGVGPGQYMPYYSQEYHMRPEISLRPLPKPRRAHNVYAEVAAESGGVGLAIFLAIPLTLMTRLWRARRRFAQTRPDLALQASCFILAILGYLGTGMFLSLAYERYYWLLLALAGAALQVLQRAPRRRVRPDPPAAAGL